MTIGIRYEVENVSLVAELRTKIKNKEINIPNISAYIFYI